MIRSRELAFAYDSQNKFEFPDIYCGAGEGLLILGPSGMGKTTLLHLLAGLLRPSAGVIEIDGVDLTQLRDRELDRFRGANVGIIFQRNHFIGALSIEENLNMAARLAGKSVANKTITGLLANLGIAEKAGVKPANLSEGQKQRASIARAMVNQPKVLLADEPSSALDDENCHQVIDLLKHQASQQQAALLIVTHDQRLREAFSNVVQL